MADESQLLTVAADLGSSPQQLEKLKSLLNEQSTAIEKFISVTAKLDKDSKKLEVTFEGISAAFEKVNASLAIGPKGGVAGLEKVLKLSEQVLTTQQVLSRQAEQNAKAASVLPASAIDTATLKFLTQLQTAMSNLEVATKSLAKTETAAAVTSEEAAGKRETAVRRAQNAARRLISQTLGNVPANASASEISSLQAATDAFAQSLISKGGTVRKSAGEEALKSAGTAAIDLTKKLSDVEVSALAVKQAYDSLGEAAKRAEEKAANAAKRQSAKAVKDAEDKKAEADAQAQAQKNKEAAAERLRQAASIGNQLRTQFIPAGTLAPQDLAKFEAAIRRAQKAIADGKFDAEAFNRAILEIRNNGQTSFSGLNSEAIRLIASLVRAKAALTDVKVSSSLPIEDRIRNATEAVTRFQTQFSKPLADAGLNTGNIDKLIERLGVLVRTSGISKDRLNELFNALQQPGGLTNVTGELSSAERQLGALIRRIQEFHSKAATGAAQSQKAQADYTKRIEDAKPALQQLVNILTSQFGGPKSLEAFVAIQKQIDQLVDKLGKGKISLQEFQKNLESLKASISSGGSGGIPPLRIGGGTGGGGGDELVRLKKLFDDTGKSGTEAGRSLLLTWENVFRIFQVQILHQVLGQIIGDFRQSIETAKQFEIRISEIRTVSQDAQLSTAQWSRELRNLSDSFGLPLLDVTRAAYDAISNQVVRGAQTFEFLRTTLEFAQTTVSSATDAQNLLSSAIKSYGDDNLTAQRAAQVLFATIDLGRVTASEMSNTFGRVATLAASAGVKFEELSAAIATLTVRGVRYSEAYTLVNNVILKLLKPTEGMKQLFDQWGVSTGEAAIDTFGFVGVLRLLQQEAQKGGVAKLAEDLRDIRAIRGAVGLVGDDAFRDFESNLQQITESSEKFKRATEIIKESSGQQLKEQLQQIQNILAVDIGEKFIKSVLATTAPFGGLVKMFQDFVTVVDGAKSIVFGFIELLDRLANVVVEIIDPFKILRSLLVIDTKAVDIVKTLAQLYVSYQLAILAVTAAQKIAIIVSAQYELAQKRLSIATAQVTTTQTAAAAATTSYGSAVTALGGPVGIAIAAVTALTFVYTQQGAILDRINNALSQETETLRRNTENQKLNAIAREKQSFADGFKNNDEEIFRKINFAVAAATKAMGEYINAAKDANNVNLSEISSQAESVFDFVKQKQTELREYITNVDRDFEKSKRRIQDIQAAGATKIFDNSLIDVTEIDRLEIVRQRIDAIRQEVGQLANDRQITIRYRVDGLSDAERTFGSINEAQTRLQNLLDQGRGKTEEAIALRERLASIDVITPDVLETARNNYDELIKLSAKHIDAVENSIRAQQKLVSDLDVKAEQRSFERSLVGKGSVESTLLTLKRSEELRGQAISLFNNGDLEESRKKFEEIDNLLQKIFDRQKSFREKAAKLGVVFNTPLAGGEVSKALDKNQQDRRELEVKRLDDLRTKQKQLSDQQKGALTELIQLEASYQRQQKDRIAFFTDNEKRIQELRRTVQEISSGRQSIGQLAQQANQQRSSGKEILQTNIDASAKSIEAFQNAIAGGSAVEKFLDGYELRFGFIEGRLKSIRQLLDDISKNPGDNQNFENLLRMLQEVRENYKNIYNIRRLDGESDKEMQDRLEKFHPKDLQRLKEIEGFYNNQINLIQQILQGRNKAAEAEGRITDATKAQETLRNRIAELTKNNPELSRFASQFEATIAPNTGLENFSDKIKSQADRISEGLDRLVNVLSRIPQAPNVIRPADNFAPQLRSLNLGFEPPGIGGTSLTMGDINVTVQSSGNSELDGRTIANVLNREIRRGTIKLG